MNICTVISNLLLLCLWQLQHYRIKRVRLFEGKSFILCPDSDSLVVSDVLLMLKKRKDFIWAMDGLKGTTLDVYWSIQNNLGLPFISWALSFSSVCVCLSISCLSLLLDLYLFLNLSVSLSISPSFSLLYYIYWSELLFFTSAITHYS